MVEIVRNNSERLQHESVRKGAQKPTAREKSADRAHPGTAEAQSSLIVSRSAQAASASQASQQASPQNLQKLFVDLSSTIDQFFAAVDAVDASEPDTVLSARTAEALQSLGQWNQDQAPPQEGLAQSWQELHALFRQARGILEEFSSTRERPVFLSSANALAEQLEDMEESLLQQLGPDDVSSEPQANEVAQEGANLLALQLALDLSRQQDLSIADVTQREKILSLIS